MKKVKKALKTKEPKGLSQEKKSTLYGILLIIAAITLGISTYVFYQKKLVDITTSNVAAWSFIVNDKETSFTADLGDQLKPGSEGLFTLNLSAIQNGVGVDATISFENQTNWPEYLKLYADKEHNNEIVPGKTTLTRTIAAGDTTSVIIYYYWPKSGKKEKEHKSNVFINLSISGQKIEQ